MYDDQCVTMYGEYLLTFFRFAFVIFPGAHDVS